MNMASMRAETLANQLQQLTDEFTREVEQISDEAWRRRCEAEGWSVGVTAHHAVGGHLSPETLGLVQAVATGQPVPALTLEMVHQQNAAHAAAHGDCTKQETLDLLRRNGEGAISAIRDMSDAELDRAVDMPAAGGMVTAGQLIEGVVIGQVQQHLDSLRATR